MNGYKLLGYVLWRVARWYVRRHHPSRRELTAVGVAGARALAAAVVLLRRGGT
jgi:hypothetical protein